MAVTNFAGADPIPARFDWEAGIAAINGLVGFFAVPSRGVVKDVAGAISTVTAVAGAAPLRTFQAPSDPAQIPTAGLKRDGIPAMSLAPSGQLDGPASDFTNSVTIFAMFHALSGESGVIFGDLGGGAGPVRFSIDVSAPQGAYPGQVRVRFRADTELFIHTRPGWHFAAFSYDHTDGSMRAQLDGGPILTGATSQPDASPLLVGSSGSSGLIRAWGYSDAENIADGTIAPFYAYCRDVLGARQA